MPQARLIDVNTAAIKHRNEITAGLDSRNYDKVFGALYSLNALLPEANEDDGRQKYRITISDELYNQFVKRDTFAICSKCKKESNIKDIKIEERLSPVMVQVVIEAQSMKFWKCPKCHESVKHSETEFIEEKLKEPFFIRVIPSPPSRKDGLHDRSGYHRKMTQWAYTFLQELEASIAQFRDDNWQKGDDMEDSDNLFIEGGENPEE